MLIRFDPFRTTDWMFGRATMAMPMDAVRRDDAGVLTVVIRVRDAARPRRIAIDHGNGAQAISASAQ